MFFLDIEIVSGAFLVVQWLRMCHAVQGTQARLLTQEDPTRQGPTEPKRHSYWAPYSGARKPQLLRPRVVTTEARVP